MTKTITINEIEWYLFENGNCYNAYNVFYNVYTKKSNLNKLNEDIVKTLEEHYKGGLKNGK